MFKIKKANIKDAGSIVNVVSSVLLENLNNKENGFLMSDKDWLNKKGEEFYKKIIRGSQYCYVALDNGKIIGFLIAFTKDQFFLEDDIQKFILNKFSTENIVYIFQIAIKPEYQNKGIGWMLYKNLFEDTKNIKKAVVTSYKPYNKASEKFHLNLGFRKLGKFKREDGGWSFYYELEG